MVDTDTVARQTAQVVQAAGRTGMPGKDQPLGRCMYMVVAAHMTLAGTDPRQGKAVARGCKEWGKVAACNKALGTAVVYATRSNLSQEMAQGQASP